jgi:hypothetical protein
MLDAIERFEIEAAALPDCPNDASQTVGNRAKVDAVWVFLN